MNKDTNQQQINQQQNKQGNQSQVGQASENAHKNAKDSENLGRSASSPEKSESDKKIGQESGYNRR